METFNQKEHVLLGYSPQTQFKNSPKLPPSSPDMDFSDVFGGPPRRFSIQEMRGRHSFGEEMESEEDAVLPRRPWSGFEEKPVFGAENVSKRPYPGDDFFDDIYRGDDSNSYNSPRRTSMDFFGSTPGSQVLSPARPLPPKSEPFGPAQFSLPAKLTKAVDFPAFASPRRSPYKSKDGTSNVSLSRFSSQATEVLDEIKNDSSFYRRCSLSHEVSHSSKESSSNIKSDGKEKKEKLKAPTSSGQFHFSIYKWAGKGVPFLMPLMGSYKSRSKERSKLERCASYNGRIRHDTINRGLVEVEDYIVSVNTESESLNVKIEEREDRSREIKMEKSDIVEENLPEIPESENHGSGGHAIPQDQAISRRKTEESHSVYEKTEKEIYTNKEQASKSELKPLHALLSDEKQEGDATEGEAKTVENANVAGKNANVSNSVKKTNAKTVISNRPEVTNVCSQSSGRNSGDASGKLGAEGKVREFVKIFNQETSAKPKIDFDLPSQNSRWKGTDVNGKENEMNNVAKPEEKVQVPNKKNTPDEMNNEGDTLNKDKFKQDLYSKSSVHKTSSPFTNEKSSSYFSDSLPDDCEVKVESRVSFQVHLLVEELSHVEDKVRAGGNSEDIKALDAKILQWSNGRKGNIRSLLSTLQYVLWPESGWKPVPLVDIIEGSAVKRAYQKALLCLHPDKLQQKGAASHQKYTAEKVFDILQEAWDHFNILGSI